MPIINGQKMACEPCIRGHRSTKCQHANERVMVPVRKPGRPLTNCPHPSSRGCRCSVVTAAIPKRQTCRCDAREASDSPQPPSINGAAPAVPLPESTGPVEHSMLFASPQPLPQARPGTAPAYRITKPSSRIPSRKTTLPESPHWDNVSLAMMLGQGPAMRETFQTSQGTQMPMWSAKNSTTYGSLFAAPAVDAIGNGSFGNGHAKPDTSANSSRTSSCCSSQPVGPKPRSASVPMPASPQKSGVSDCCSSKPLQPSTQFSALPPPVVPNGVDMSSSFMGTNVYNGFMAQSSVFSAPGSYGSFDQPLQPTQYRPMMNEIPDNNNNNGLLTSVAPTGQLPPAHDDYKVSMAPQNMAFGMGPVPASTWPVPNRLMGHECGCGPSCACLGCATHPYNKATRSYVWSGWSSQQDSEKRESIGRMPDGLSMMQKAAPTTTSPTTGGIMVPVAGGNGIMTTTLYLSQNAGGDAVSPTDPTTPSSETTSVDDQTLPEQDFIFVNYSFPGLCGGTEACCPCGDDCSCLGCKIHGNSQDFDFDALGRLDGGGGGFFDDGGGDDDGPKSCCGGGA